MWSILVFSFKRLTNLQTLWFDLKVNTDALHDDVTVAEATSSRSCSSSKTSSNKSSRPSISTLKSSKMARIRYTARKATRLKGRPMGPIARRFAKRSTSVPPPIELKDGPGVQPM